MLRRLWCFFLLMLVSCGNLLAQNMPDSDWQQIIPVARFGYGGLLSVYWSPIIGQLTAATLKIELSQLVSDDAAAQWSPDRQVIAAALRGIRAQQWGMTG